MKKAYLVLSNGRVFEGTRLGAEGTAMGELVFTTGVVGYLETLTDPSFAGQIVVQTFPLIGNYGIMEEDAESGCVPAGYVVRECCDAPSNFRSQYELDAFLKARGVAALCGVDTREITRLLREEGTMSALITDEIPADFAAACTAPAVTAGATAPAVCPAEGDRRFAVTLIDYGVRRSTVRSLCQRGCEVTVVPKDTAAETILAAAPDGVVLSEGPGDPAAMTAYLPNIQKLIGQVPVLGLGLGHQLAALAMGGETVKLPHGHRGGNQPVSETAGTRTYITAQNHGYTVVGESLNGVAKVSFVNANDGTCEGLTYPGKSCFTLQFTPDGGTGPHSTGFLFDRFLSMMAGVSHA